MQTTRVERIIIGSNSHCACCESPIADGKTVGYGVESTDGSADYISFVCGSCLSPKDRLLLDATQPSGEA
jgi:hypothetical protein